MSSTIPLPLAKWLQKEKVLPRRAPEVYPAPGYEKKLLTVKGSTWVKFQNGYAVALLLRGLEANPKYGMVGRQSAAVVNTLRKASTATSMLYNWNVLGPILETHGVPMLDTTKARIVAGDPKALVSVLRNIKNQVHNFQHGGKKETLLPTGRSDGSEASGGPASPVAPARKTANGTEEERSIQSTLSGAQRAQRLAKVLPLLPPNSSHEREASSIASSDAPSVESTGGSKTIVEFLVTSLCKAFKVNPRGAALMLTVHAPRLVGLCTDGPYKAIKRWLHGLTMPISIERIVALVTKRPDDMYVFMNVLRPCFLTSNPSVVRRATKLVTLLLTDIRTKIGDRKKTGMVPSSKSFNPRKGKSEILSKQRAKQNSSKKGGKKPTARQRQEAARENARTPLERVLHIAWTWFSSQTHSGLICALQAVHDHQTLNKEITEMIRLFSAEHFQELLQVHFRKIQDQDVPAVSQLAFLHQFLKVVAKDSDGKRCLVQNGLLKKMSTFALDLSYSNQALDVQIAAVQFLLEIWLLFPETITNEEEQPSRVLALLRKLCRAPDASTVMTALGGLFDLTERCLKLPSPKMQEYASKAYKMLIFSLIESISILGVKKGSTKTNAEKRVMRSRKKRQVQDDPNAEVTLLRSFIAVNMTRLLEMKTGACLPTDVLLEPLVRQVSLHGYNVEDLALLNALSKHPRASLRSTVLLMDFLANVTLSDPVYSQCTAGSFVNAAEMYLDESPMQTYIIRIARVAAGMYVQADEHVMVAKRGKNKYERKGPADEHNDHRGKKRKGESKHADERELSNDECMQIIICGLLEKIICLNNGHIRHSVCSILHTASELITNVHAKEAQRLEEMKGRSEKRKERKAKLSSKDAGKRAKRDSIRNIPNGVKQIRNLLQMLKAHGVEIQDKTPLLEGPSKLEQLPSLGTGQGKGFNLESSSFEGLKEALMTSFVGKGKNAPAEKVGNKVISEPVGSFEEEQGQSSPERTSSRENGSPVKLSPLQAGPREATLLRTPSPSYNIRNPRKKDNYLKEAKKRQHKSFLAEKAKKKIDEISMNRQVKLQENLLAEKNRMAKEEELKRKIRKHYVQGREKWLQEKEFKETQDEELEQTLKKFNLNVDGIDPKALLEKVQLKDADVLHAKAKVKQFKLAENFVLSELIKEDSKARAKIMGERGVCEVARRTVPEFKEMNNRLKRAMRHCFKIFTTIGGADAQRTPTFEEVRRSNLTIDMGEWLQMLGKLSLSPPIERTRATSIFHKSLNHLRDLGMEIEEQELGYPGFLTAIRMLSETASGLVVEDIMAKEDSEMCSRMSTYSASKLEQSQSLPYDNWERFWEWFKLCAEEKLSNFGVRAADLDDETVLGQFEEQKKFIEEVQKRKSLKLTGSPMVVPKPVKEIPKVQGFGSTLKLDETEEENRKKQAEKARKNAATNKKYDQRYGRYGRHCLERLPTKSKRAGEFLLGVVEAMVEVAVAKSEKLDLRLLLLAKSATSQRAKEALLAMHNIRKEGYQSGKYVEKCTKRRKEIAERQNVLRAEKEKELVLEQKLKAAEKTLKEQREKKRLNGLKKRKKIADEHRGIEKLERQATKTEAEIKKIKAREILDKKLQKIETRNKRREAKRQERLSKKKLEEERIKKQQEENIDKILKPTREEMKELEEIRAEERKIVRAEQMMESKRRGEARRKAVLDKKLKKLKDEEEAKMAAKRRIKKMERNNRAKRVVTRASELHQKREKRLNEYVRHVGGRGNVASVHIQALYRGHYARNHLDESKAKVVEARKKKREETQNEAATKIQKIARGRQGKSKVAMVRKRKENEAKEKERLQQMEEAIEKKREEDEAMVKEKMAKEVEEHELRDRAKARRRKPPVTNEDAELRAREYLKDIWRKYDKDMDNCLNAVEFKSMVDEFCVKSKILLPECERFLAFVDQNGDNLLEIEELVSFIVKGLKINENQRAAWKSKSPLHSKLLEFIDGIKQHL
jgi:hypothetical protein